MLRLPSFVCPFNSCTRFSTACNGDRTNADIILIDVINAGDTFIYFILISMVFKEHFTMASKVKTYRKIIINYV